MKEIEKAPRNIKIEKAAGDDNIESKTMKWMDEEEKRWLHIIWRRQEAEKNFERNGDLEEPRKRAIWNQIRRFEGQKDCG